jgi:two-component system nitrogen regulation sensor histidine kinase GlnL
MIDAQRQLSSLSLAVVLLAPGQKVAAANPAAEQLLGQSFRRLEGRAIGDLLHFAESRIGERIGESRGAAFGPGHCYFDQRGQPLRQIDLTLAPVIDQPGWQVMTLIDIGGAEALRETPAAGEGGVLRAPEVLAHEIKNPLAGIRGAAQLLGRKLEGKDLALTSLIADEVDRIAKLIDQMQSLSRRTAAGTGPVQPPRSCPPGPGCHRGGRGARRRRSSKSSTPRCRPFRAMPMRWCR